MAAVEREREAWELSRPGAFLTIATARAGLFSATVPPRAILALFANEGEQEVVVNPNMLRGRITLDEEVAPAPDEMRGRALYPNIGTEAP